MNSLKATPTATDHQLPDRFQMPSIFQFIVYFGFVAFFVFSLEGAKISLTDLVDGIPNMARLVNEMTPPSLNRIQAISLAILQTFQMALVGAGFGILISFFLAMLASTRNTPHAVIYYITRMLIAFCRSVPDLVWAILFVASVGLGTFAGTLTIVVDTIGFCGRFFAEAMEEVNQGPEEALKSIGANRFDIIISAVLPAAMPSFVNSALFALEKAVRSSVVLGLVGAGGIGIELKVAMDMFQYQEAATIILGIFILVIVVEQLSTYMRKKFL